MSQVPAPAARLESLATTVTPLPSVAAGAYRASASVDVGSALDGPEERRPKRGDEDYVPRPPNPFMLFRSWYCWYWKWRRPPGVNLNEAATREWNAFSPEERAPWEALAKEKKKEHETLYPNYKYKPQSRSANSHVSAPGSTTAPRSNHSASNVSPSPLYQASQNANEPLRAIFPPAQSPMLPPLTGTGSGGGPGISSPASFQYTHPLAQPFSPPSAHSVSSRNPTSTYGASYYHGMGEHYDSRQPAGANEIQANYCYAYPPTSPTATNPATHSPPPRTVCFPGARALHTGTGFGPASSGW